jgi:hypothetical protein
MTCQQLPAAMILQPSAGDYLPRWSASRLLAPLWSSGGLPWV